MRYPRASIGAAFDNVITSPFTGPFAPVTGAPYARRIEIVNATAFPASNVEALGVPANVKPTSVRAWSWNVGSTMSGGPAPGASALITIPGLNVENGNDVAAYNAANPAAALIHWRIIPTISSANWYGATTPLRAQAAAPLNSPNPPFARVDFYRLNAVTDIPWTGALVPAYWSYLGSAAAGTSNVITTDQGTYRSYVYVLAATVLGPGPAFNPTGFVTTDWKGGSQVIIAGAAAPGTFPACLTTANAVMAVGVIGTGIYAGDAIATLGTCMGTL